MCQIDTIPPTSAEASIRKQIAERNNVSESYVARSEKFMRGVEIMEQMVPEDHFLRKVDRAVDFSFIYDLCAPLYCADNGRPAIDPEILFRMLLVGDGMERQEMEQLVKELRLDDVCIFTGAIRDREKLRTYFSLSDLFLFPSTFDTNGIVVREAAACGTASVLVRGSCAAEDVTEDGNALLIEENAASLKALLERVGTNRPALRDLGQRALEQLYLSWEDSVTRAYARYGTVLDHYRRGLSGRSIEWTDELYNLLDDLRRNIEAARNFKETSRRKLQERLRR